MFLGVFRLRALLGDVRPVRRRSKQYLRGRRQHERLRYGTEATVTLLARLPSLSYVAGRACRYVKCDGLANWGRDERLMR